MEQLKRWREARGLSQTKLAARADVNPATVNQIEGGKRTASPATLHKLAEALDVSLYDLLEGGPRPKVEVLPESRIEALAADLRERGIELNDSEVHVLGQYIALREQPPTDPVAIWHGEKQGEPVDHERVKTLLAYLAASGMLTEDAAEALRGALHEELLGARAPV
jgi:transcriptional regulator with XRE-family HTH domain